MLNFAWSWAFWLLPLPLIAYKLMPIARKYDAALFVPFFQDVFSLEDRQGRAVRSGIVKVLLLIAAWFLLVSALGRPQWTGDPVALPASGRDLLLAVDISGSMQQEDMIVQGKQVSRIALVKYVVNDFVDRRTGDRVGLLLFGTEAYMQVPLTFDRQTLQTLFNEAQIGFAGTKTSIGDAIGLAVKHLQNRPDDSRVCILLTDGRNTAGNVEPLQAAKLAAQTGVKIYTIGVGADEMLVRDLFGTRRVNPSADLDEETLQKIAELTGGRYFRARNPEELEQVYTYIDKLEPVEQEAETYRPVKSLYYWPLAAALLVSFLVTLLYVPFSFLGRRGEV
jgi:Ca-activated chloride channel family protein